MRRMGADERLPSFDDLLDEVHLHCLVEATREKSVDVDTTGNRLTEVVTAIPNHFLKARRLARIYQLANPLAQDIENLYPD